MKQLAGKIRGGGTGVWGQEVMPAHPLMTMQQAQTIAEYMLSVNDKRLSSLPLQGTYTPTLPEGDSGRGSLVVRAIYSDKGAADLPALTTEATTVLRSPRLGPQAAEVQQGVTAGPTRGAAGAVIPKANAHIGFKGIDLTGVTRLEVMAQANARNGQAGGTIDVRTGSATGPVIGQADLRMPRRAAVVQRPPRFRPPAARSPRPAPRLEGAVRKAAAARGPRAVR